MSEDYSEDRTVRWPGRDGKTPADYDEHDHPTVDIDATIRLIHPSVISDARAYLGARQYNIVHARLGQEPPDVVDHATLHIAQRWHGIKADAYLMQDWPAEAVAHSLAGLELGSAHGGDDPDQHIYTATLFCTFAEASRRAGQIDEEILEGLREFILTASANTSESIVALVKYAQRTLDLAQRGRTRGITDPLSTQFQLPF